MEQKSHQSSHERASYKGKHNFVLQGHTELLEGIIYIQFYWYEFLIEIFMELL